MDEVTTIPKATIFIRCHSIISNNVNHLEHDITLFDSVDPLNPTNEYMGIYEK